MLQDGLSYLPGVGLETTLLSVANLFIWLRQVCTPAFEGSCPPLGIQGRTLGPLGCGPGGAPAGAQTESVPLMLLAC